MFVNWLQPIIESHNNQLQVAIQQLRLCLSLQDLGKLCSLGVVCDFNNNIAMYTNNTQYQQVRCMGDVIHYAKLRNDDYTKTYSQIMDRNISMPILMETGMSQYYLIAGNTTLMMCKVLSIVPKV